MLQCLSDKYATVSDMPSSRITVRVPQSLTARLRTRSQATGTTESEVVREALDHYLGRPGTERTAYELAAAAGLIGFVRNAAPDLSTNQRHFRGFGKSSTKQQ